MFQLNRQDQETLLQIARESVQAYLMGQELDLPSIASEDLMQKRGVFVSVHVGTNLRGCVGTIDPRTPLYQSVSGCAVAAASKDSRFKPLQLPELPEAEFEISVLSPVEDVTDIQSIEIGTHGLIISRGNAKGLLLPQVAVHQQWDRERFLGETCRKAGLPPTAWKQGATIQRFTAEVFP
jgi:AmmeMemoRadiSam system protein A